MLVFNGNAIGELETVVRILDTSLNSTAVFNLTFITAVLKYGTITGSQCVQYEVNIIRLT